MSDVFRERAFMELYRDGAVTADDVDDFVDRWHAAACRASNPPSLHEFLGMTGDEYASWVHDPASLPHIARARMSDAPRNR